MTVAITGASGFLGRNLLLKLLQSRDTNIRVLSRSLLFKNDDIFRDSNLKYYLGDLLDAKSLINFLEPECTVINLVYSMKSGEDANLQMTRNLISACQDIGIKRLIHCSTAEVFGRTEENPVTENTPCNPITSYGVTKLKIEKIISEGGNKRFAVAILRPTAVFGPKGENLKKLSRDMIVGSRVKNYIKSCLFGARRMNLVSITNVVNAVIFLAGHKTLINNNVFILSDDNSSANTFEYVERVVMEKLNIKAYTNLKITVPPQLLEILLRIMGRNNINPKRNYSSEKLVKLGFVPEVSFEAALDKYAEGCLTSLRT